jgi:hypothetical protein
MNAEQIAIATLHAQELQIWVTGIAIVLGPLAGVLFTLWFQARKERTDAKHALFMALMAERKASVSPQLAQALNKIDVVFADAPRVKATWHEYYDLLSGQPSEQRGHKWLELLSLMATELGYRKLSQIELDKFYLPQGHVDDAEFQRNVAQQWARVLEKTERFLVEPR